MGSFGERLQREREMRSISLEEIADSTKISCRFLRALETEDFSKLPGGIFNKGFVRAYAKYLGIDEEQAVTDFVAAESGAIKIEKPPVVDPNQPSLFTASSNGHKDHTASNIYAAAASRTEAEDAPPQQGGPMIAAAVILVMVLGIGGLTWKFFNDRSKAEATAPVHAQQAQQPVAQTQSQPVSTQPANSDLLPPVSSVNNDVPSAVPVPTTGTNTSADSSNLAVSSKPLESAIKPEGSKPAETAKPMRLSLKTNTESWVQVTADGKLMIEGVLPPATIRSFRAEKEMVVKLGNAAGVDVSYNGKSLPAFPSDAKTRTLTFSPEGLRQ